MKSLALVLLAAALQAGDGKPAPAVAGKNVPWVKVNTVGYANTWPKVAIVAGEPKGAALVLQPYEGELREIALPASAIRPFGADQASGETLWQVDFSAVTRTGRYRLRIDGLDGVAPDDAWRLSAPFEIGAAPYARALVASQKMFYYQRTRTRLKEPYTLWEEGDDDYTRAAPSHTHADVGWLLDTYPKKEKKWPLERGWFDAGNLDMYIPSTAPSAQMLLLAYELSPAAFGDANGIPESGNKIPDILDEATWGLDWVAGMQEKDGAFRAREATMQLGEVQGGDASKDKTVRWVSGIASASTAKAVAALATAARVYAPFDKARAARYGKAALKGWQWLQANPQRVSFNAYGSGQPMWDDGSEHPVEDGCRGAAAFAMWRAFRNKEALAELERRWGTEQLATGQMEGGWPNIGRFAVFGVLLDPQSPAELRDQARQRLLEAVAPYKDSLMQDGYRCALKPSEYYWGSPTVLLEKAVLLALAAREDPAGHAWAEEAARDQWHWVLGRNPNGYSLVSRVGKGPTRIYHLEWGKKSAPPPGYLIDGPNHHNAKFLSPDAPAKALLWFSPVDLPSGVKAGDPFHNDQNDLWDGGFIPRDTWSTGWWVVTEVDLYYNAALVLAASLIVP